MRIKELIILFVYSMNIFPSTIYEFKLINGQTETLERLNRRTEESESLMSKVTEKSFIGKVKNNNFRIISSNIGKGAFCTLTGFIKEEKGEVLVEINKPFKILLTILMLFPFIAFFIQSFSKSTEFNPIFILICIGQILIIRFFFIGLFFKILSKQSLNRLSDVLDTEWVKKKPN
ncbi:hypothetical protein [Epilithonimonas sp.]|uniref:hypothetical protein n=1 Tax=Epilithonimonas sp. TaxID=2894511 RepID=UPI002897FDCB|nr:hypothetical protein [Epilithonimonas sp.]